MIRAKQLVLVSVALLMVACSTLKLSYNNAEWLLARALNSYFDLDDAQAAQARLRVRALLVWHRQTQLAPYAQLITDAAQLIQHPVSDADVIELIQRMNTKFAELGLQAAPALAKLLLTLNSSQIARWERKQAESAAELRDELLEVDNDSKAKKPRIRWYKTRAKFWFGSVTPQQMAIMRTITGTRPVGEMWWISERERRQREFVELLNRLHNERPSTDEAAQWIQTYIDQLISPPDPERHVALLQFRHSNATLVAQLVNAATLAQRQSLTKKLRGYVEDLMALAQFAPKEIGVRF